MRRRSFLQKLFTEHYERDGASHTFRSWHSKVETSVNRIAMVQKGSSKTSVVYWRPWPSTTVRCRNEEQEIVEQLIDKPFGASGF